MKYVNFCSFANKQLNRLEVRAGRSRLYSRPVLIGIEPTLQCNANCVMCNRNANRHEEVKTGGFITWQTLSKLRPYFRTAEAVLFSGFGEPLLHPEYLPMLRFIKQEGPEVFFYTNGTLIDREVSGALIDIGVDLMCISFGGARPETYRKIRGVEMAPIVENLKILKRLKEERGSSKPDVHFNIVAMNSVLAELDEVIHLASQLGVSGISMPNLVVQEKALITESPWMDLDRAKKRLQSAEMVARDHGIDFLPPKFISNQCFCDQFFSSMTVTWDGLVLSCPMERYIFGNVNAQPVHQIWNSPGVVKLRRRVIREGFEDICSNCFCWDHRADAFIRPHYNSRLYAGDLRIQ